MGLRMIKWKIRIYEFILAFALLGGAYLWVGHNAVAEYKTEQAIVQMKADKTQQAKYDKLSSDYEQLKTQRQQSAKTIIKEVEKVVDRPIYSNVCFDYDGLRLANEAISGRIRISKPDAEVPANTTP